MLDFSTSKDEILDVQQAICPQRSKHILDSRDQLPRGLLNTCRACVCALGLSLWNLPSLGNKAGLLSGSRDSGRSRAFLLSRKTALRHKFAGTWAARLRAMLPPAVANEQHEAPHRKEKENVILLEKRVEVFFFLRPSSALVLLRGDKGGSFFFLFCFTFPLSVHSFMEYVYLQSVIF